ncbi:MAG TPA: hypothetical protein VFR00_11790 [Hyphomicrobiaceae bacterium]|nr:hypothetical protein [Hyphomicrobiaceae bacterium]
MGSGKGDEGDEREAALGATDEIGTAANVGPHAWQKNCASGEL